ncbi:hypothetical protein BGAL_0173g00100 [Botrytis galanthina]|uniref:Heterokaryon incompatibility domain-containing protein n=1 Tax=Botrytis galanthina TaxID=278940 RepID=A0A4S8R9E3_9HELO|nr:hypothetical protein BGAL_0173g00100 [Botrytis galanthina]
MLCKVCDRLNVTDLLKLAKANNTSRKIWNRDGYLYFKHHKRYDDLVTAASSGCELCLFLQQQYEEEEIFKSVTREQEFRMMEAKNRPMNLRVEIKASHLDCGQLFEEGKVFDHLTFRHWESGVVDGTTFMFSILQTPKDQPKFIDDTRIGQFIVDEDLASDTNFDIARGWMNTCIVEHSQTKCPSFEDKVLPSRVIDVGLEDTNPSLFVTNGLRGKWIALSHCWGGQIETILTTSNLQSLQKEIKMPSLPANFRDAILITRALGFQFLWIDSLCIIQDSKYDWGIESKKMGDIYRNAVLTIAAAAAHKAADGMLHTQSQISRGMQPKLKLSKDSGSDDVVEIASSVFRRENLTNLIEDGPLQSRAWTFQERVLSPRILWYGRRQIYWQCPCEFQSADGTPSGGEAFPSSENYIYPIITQRAFFSQNYNGGSMRFSEEELLEMNHEYQSMVIEYCTRALSYPNDKLPAFSGIAALLHKRIGGNYLAEIWSRFFRENLLWKSLAGDAPHKLQYRAPSWSWAVTDEGTHLHYFNSSRLASTPHDTVLLSHHIELSSENPYGAVKYAHIIIDTLTLKLTHLGQYRNLSNKTGFFLFINWFGDTGLSSLFPLVNPEWSSRISRQIEGEMEIQSGKPVVPISIETRFGRAKLRTCHSFNWDEGTPDWSAVSPLEYKVMLVGLEQQSEKCRDDTTPCLKCLILQEDPEDAKVCRRVGQAELKFFHKEADKPDLDAWLASDCWERETLKLI